MGLWNKITNAVEDVRDTVVETVEEASDIVVDTTEKASDVAVDIGKVAVAPITLPAQIAIDVLTGQNPLQSVAQTGQNVVNLVNDAPVILDIATSPSVVGARIARGMGTAIDAPANIIIDLSSHLGDTGKIIAETTIGASRIATEVLVSGASVFADILKGNSPLELGAIPLAVAINTAAGEVRQRAKLLPEVIKLLLSDFYTPEVLNRAKYTTGSVGITLPEIINKIQTTTIPRVFMGAEAHAVTVDDIIVFSELPVKEIHGLSWLAHELHHVVQYTEWGVERFAYEYMIGHEDVEDEADRKAERVMDRLDRSKIDLVFASIAGDLLLP
jgi:hypothetical protein